MTRRDYCAVCGKMVGDYGVVCQCCGESFCSSCSAASSNDPSSFMASIVSRIMDVYKPSFSLEDFSRFITCLQLEGITAKYTADYDEEEKEDFEKYKNNLIAFYEFQNKDDYNEQMAIIEMKEFILSLYDNFHFTCTFCSSNR